MSHQARQGAIAAASAYILWGLTPIYFKAVQSASAHEIVAHRIVWSAVLLALVLAITGRMGGVRTALKTPKIMRTLMLCAALITSNWLIYVWAINNRLILDASLGYYINPLFSIALGAIFLGERLRRIQLIAVFFAFVGVANEMLTLGHPPWISLSLAITFGLYGLLRKRAHVDAGNGLFIETACLTPMALAWMAWSGSLGELAILNEHSPRLTLLLLASGVITSLPLVLFAYGAKRLTLATLGFIQYLSPSITLLLAIFVYGESIGPEKMTSFALIWTGLLIYTLDTSIRRRAAINTNIGGDTKTDPKPSTSSNAISSAQQATR